MTDSSATYTRNIICNLPDFPSGTIIFRLVTYFASAGTEGFPKRTYTLTLSSGEGTQALPTPDNTGAASWGWSITLPDGNTYSASLPYGDDLQLTHWLLGAGCFVTEWETIGASAWSDFHTCMISTNDFVTGGSGTTVTRFGSFGAGALKWTTGPLLPTGEVFAVPHNSAQVLIVDPENQTSRSFGSLGATAGKWIGAVLHPNGNVYCIPAGATAVLKVDPVNETTSTFGSITAFSVNSGTLLPDGRICCCTRNGTAVYIIDPDTETISSFGSLPSGALKWANAVLLPSGKVLFTPLTRATALVVDVDNQTTSEISGTLTGQYAGGCLIPDGRVVCTPYSATQVLIIDPTAETFTTFGSLGSGLKWVGAVLLPDGRVMGIPLDSTEILIIDPTAETTSTFGSVTGTTKFEAGTLLPSGKVFSAPLTSSTALLVDMGYSGSYDDEVLLSSYLNSKF